MRTPNMTVGISKAEAKRMMAREHNRAYEAGELTRKPDLVEFVQHVAKGFKGVVDQTVPPKGE